MQLVEFLPLLTATVIILSAYRSWKLTKDPLTPLIVFTPMLLYVYCYAPMSTMFNETGWSKFPKLEGHLNKITLINLLFVTCFCLGVSVRRNQALLCPSFFARPIDLTPRMRDRFKLAGTILGVIAFLAFWYSVERSGGVVRVFSKSKAFVSAGSGYIGELPNLVFPALIMLALAWQNQRLRVTRILGALFIASPHLVMGSIGGRRGPAFLVLSTLALCYYLIRLRKPRLTTVLTGMVVIGALLFFLLTQRDTIHLGSSLDFDWNETVQAIAAPEVDSGHESVVAAAGIVACSESGQYFWGRRYAVMAFVRPIPRFFWEEKYRQVGMEWMVDAPGSYGFDDRQWEQLVGFVPSRGSAAGFVTDLFFEFGYFGCIGTYLIGVFYRKVWERSRIVGAHYTIILILMLALSVYLPSQSIQAWFVRLLVAGVPTLVYWHLLIGPVSFRRPRMREWN